MEQRAGGERHGRAKGPAWGRTALHRRRSLHRSRHGASASASAIGSRRRGGNVAFAARVGAIAGRSSRAGGPFARARARARARREGSAAKERGRSGMRLRGAPQSCRGTEEHLGHLFQWADAWKIFRMASPAMGPPVRSTGRVGIDGGGDQRFCSCNRVWAEEGGRAASSSRPLVVVRFSSSSPSADRPRAAASPSPPPPVALPPALSGTPPWHSSSAGVRSTA